MSGARALPIWFTCAVLASCTESPRPDSAAIDSSVATPWFRECATASGLDFAHTSGHASSGRFYNPEIMASGVALIDVDGDGDLDLYMLQGRSLAPDRDDDGDDGANRLYFNQGDATFARAPDAFGAGDTGYAMGAATGDFDGDGDTDVYVTNVGRNTLLRNDGTGFTDVTESAGVGGTGWSTSAGFIDADADGDLDMFVCNYFAWSAEDEYDCREITGAPDYCSPVAYDAPTPDTLYRNDGDGTFTDVSTESGIGGARGNGLGLAFGDYDDDGHADIFVANDGTPNHLWINDGTGQFVNEAIERGCAMDEAGAVKAGMGVGSADVDADGRLDLLVVNLTGETDSLFLNGGGWFAERAATAGIAGSSRAFTRFGTGFADFDNDGALDLYHANGRVRRLGRPYGDDPYAEPNLLYRGAPDGTFVACAPRGGTANDLWHRSRGAAFGDLDGDGGLDVVVGNADGPAYLLRNVLVDRGHWLAIDVRERAGGAAIGASLRIRLGEHSVRREVQTAYSYCSANSPVVHLGLGARTTVDEVRVRWSDGVTDVFGPFAADRTVVVRRGG